MSLESKIAAVQRGATPIKKDGTNPHFKRSYPTLNATLEVLAPLIDGQGLTVTHYVKDRCLVTEVWDEETTDCLTSAFPLPSTDDPQKLGSGITYGRRYNLTAIFDLTAEDDDGNFASGRSQSSNSSKKSSQPTSNNRPQTQPVTQGNGQGGYDKSTDTRKITESQASRLYSIASSNGWDNQGVKGILAQRGYTSAKDLQRNNYDAWVEYFQTHRPPVNA